MANYRCYCLDRHGCIRAVTAIAADSDERARSSAAVLLTTCAHEMAELWDGRRHVCTIGGGQQNEEAVTARKLRLGAAARPRTHRGKIAPAPHADDADRNYA
jgi:hypothetical protein